MTERFRICGELRYRANNTKDIVWSKEGLMDLALSHPVKPKKRENRGMEIIRVAVAPYQDWGYLAEITWVRKERIGGIVYDAHYASGKVFNTAEEAKRFLSQYIALNKYEKREI